MQVAVNCSQSMKNLGAGKGEVQRTQKGEIPSLEWSSQQFALVRGEVSVFPKSGDLEESISQFS